MDTMRDAILTAREEDILDQIEVLKARLRAVRSLKATLPPPDPKAQSIFRRRPEQGRGKRVKEAVLQILAAEEPLFTAEITKRLAAMHLVDIEDNNDKAYIRATLQRTKEIKNTSDGWVRS